MPWRWVGLQGESPAGQNISRVRVSDDGELLVTMSGSGDIGSITIEGIDTSDVMSVSLADIATTDQLTVKIAEALADLPVRLAASDIDLSVQIANAAPLTVDIDGAVQISGTVPVTLSGPDPLPVLLSGEPIAVEFATGGPAASGPVTESGFGGDPRTVTAPDADELITNHYPGTPGELHLIEVTTWFSEGTPLAADNYNMAFKFGGTVISRLPVMLALNIPITSRFYFNSATDTPFGVHAVNAGTSGVTYNAFLTATRLV